MTEHHVTPKSVYYGVFVILLVLLIATIGAAMLTLPPPFHIIVAMTIAVAKALLVILYFMHVRDSGRLTWVFAGAGFFWLAILISLSLSDYLTRIWFTVPGT